MCIRDSSIISMFQSDWSWLRRDASKGPNTSENRFRSYYILWKVKWPSLRWYMWKIGPNILVQVIPGAKNWRKRRIDQDAGIFFVASLSHIEMSDKFLGSLLHFRGYKGQENGEKVATRNIKLSSNFVEGSNNTLFFIVLHKTACIETHLLRFSWFHEFSPNFTSK